MVTVSCSSEKIVRWRRFLFAPRWKGVKRGGNRGGPTIPGAEKAKLILFKGS